MKKVSVIIPVYMVENYIEDCVKSVLAQTLDDVEIILVNDCGTDASWERAVALTKGNDNVVLVENPHNMGLAATRNHGLSVASGEYVYYLDSDDMITPDALARLYEVSFRDELDVQIFETSFLFENADLEARFKNNPACFKGDYPDVMSGKDLFIKWMEIWDWMPSQPRFFYNRNFLMEKGIQFKEGMLHEDETYAFDVLMNASRVRITKEKFFIRRFRAASIMTGVPKIQSVEGCVYILDHVAQVKNSCRDDAALGKAIDFYSYKIFLDVSRKYRRILDSGADMEVEKKKLTSELLNSPAQMSIFNLIESYGRYNN